MPTAYIGRLDEIGLGKESTAGTAVSATIWLPVVDPTYEDKAMQDFVPGGQGTIDSTMQGYNTRLTTDINLKGSPTDKRFGHILLALFGTETPCVRHPVSGLSGTFVEGETVTESTSSATGVLIRNDSAAGTPVLYLSVATGTFVGGGKTLTGGTSGATATNSTIESPASVRYHVYRRLNTNNHPTYTIYNHSPIVDERAAYCMLDSFDVEAINGKMVSYDTKWMGKALASTGAQTPTYTAENDFVGRNGTAKTATAFLSVDASAAIDILQMKLSFTKKVEAIQSVNNTNTTAIASFHNTEWDLKGTFVLKYDITTYRDFFIAGTNQAIRLTLASTGSIGSSTTPTIQFDIPSALLTSVGIPRTQGAIVKQTIAFTAQKDATRGFPCECFLSNAQVTSY